MKTSLEYTTVTALVTRLKSAADECDQMNLALKQRKAARNASRIGGRRIVFTRGLENTSDRFSISAQNQFVTRIIQRRLGMHRGVDENVLHEIRAEELRIRELAAESQGTGAVARMAARQLARTEDLAQARLADLGMGGGKARALAQRAIQTTQQQSEFSEERWVERAEHMKTMHRSRVRL